MKKHAVRPITGAVTSQTKLIKGNLILLCRTIEHCQCYPGPVSLAWSPQVNLTSQFSSESGWLSLDVFW